LFLKKQKPDCIITFLNGPNNYAALYKCIFFWRKTRLLVGERNLDVQKLKLKDFLKRFSHIVAHKIICNSNAQLIKLSPYYGNKLVFISNGTDINGIVKKQYNIAKYDNNTKKFIVSARVVSQKNPLLLLKAIQILKNEFDFEVHWYGEIYNNDPVVKQCIDYIIQNELSSYFRFQSPTNDIYQVMKNYDALILPSFYEGCPNAVIDAMFCGLPVLASHVSDNMMYLRHQKELIFNPHLVGDLVDKLRYFFTLPVTDVINIGNENYNKAKYFFDQNKMVSKYVKLMNA
jgi:glycosyltransferase involved in cell wall biosynthesis